MSGNFLLCKVRLYILTVQDQLDSWPERGERQQHWFRLADAADLVEEPGLRAVLGSLRPR